MDGAGRPRAVAFGGVPAWPEERAEELQEFIDGAVEAVHSVGPDGRIRWANRAELDMFGYRREEYVGHHITEFHADPSLGADLLARVARGEAIRNRQAMIRCRDGREKLVLISANGVFREGQFRSSRCFTRELTYERDAHFAQARLAAIVDGSDDAIVSKDLDGTVRSWNRGARQLFGYDATEIVGDSILRVIPPELHAEERDILARISRGERIDHYETMRLRKDGSRVAVSLTVSPLRDISGRIIGASKIARDVSVQREARRGKDEFLAILAHELRNPLAPIRTSLALLRDAALPALQRDRALAIADRQMVQLTRLLEDLLDISRLSTGRVELRKQRLDLAALAAQSAESVKPYLEARRHRFRVTLPGEPLWIDADAVRIQQAISNVVTNAGKYTDPGGDVALSVAREDGVAVVLVSDTGIGFTPEMGRRLFVLFAQEKTAPGRVTGGLGIGLALVREFVERHGGTVEASSRGLGQGSEFTLRIPLAA